MWRKIVFVICFAALASSAQAMDRELIMLDIPAESYRLNGGSFTVLVVNRGAGGLIAGFTERGAGRLSEQKIHCWFLVPRSVLDAPAFLIDRTRDHRTVFKILDSAYEGIY